ncbi:aminotransferase class IV [Shouchella patagoniensis]|uniref:aminotransferase class IV n=1 Tax=Shouchella patagoniensis TaxID=228576 RepID=UPI000994E6E9|nr:aminotransferase class IV [Shouchella patagoniensis]
MLASINGKIIDYENARIHLNSLSMKYGSSVFEGIRAYKDKKKDGVNIIQLNEHIRRFFESMRLVKLECDYSREQVKDFVISLINQNKINTDIYIRLAASVFEEGEIYTRGKASITVTIKPKKEVLLKPKINVMVSSWRRINDNDMPPRIKSISNYQNSRLAMLEARDYGFDNSIILNANGGVAESPTASLFMVKDGVLNTPRITDGILESITRTLIINLAKISEIKVVEREIDRTELYLADELFIVGTGAELISIGTIDGYQFESNNSSIYEVLNNKHRSLVRGLDNYNIYRTFINSVE